MPRTPPSRGRDYRGDRTTPRRGPRSESEYSEYSEDGPTIFGSLLRTLMAGGAVVAVAILVRDAARIHSFVRVRFDSTRRPVPRTGPHTTAFAW